MVVEKTNKGDKMKKQGNIETLDKTVERIASHENPVELVNNMYGCHPTAIKQSVTRIARYKNPVELVNNMYGCHPDNAGQDYFSVIYGNL